jgi:hypothetical protein
MGRRFNTWQQNMLLTGATLGAEISAPSAHCRAFVYVSGYSIDPTRHGRPSRFLNADHTDVRFSVRVFEIDEEASRSPYDKEYAERDMLLREEIENLTNLEDLLSAYLADFTALIDYAQLDY